MAIFFSQGGPVLFANPAITKVCLKAIFETKVSLKAVFQTKISLKATWAQCND